METPSKCTSTIMHKIGEATLAVASFSIKKIDALHPVSIFRDAAAKGIARLDVRREKGGHFRHPAH
jgi:hypothetical protein